MSKDVTGFPFTIFQKKPRHVPEKKLEKKLKMN